jgi:glutamate-ammonia-ligase adenylyltransferase
MKEDVEIKLAPLPFADAIDRAAAFSPFLRGLITRRADVVAIVEGQGLPAALAWAEAASADDPDTARALRRERQAVALSVALADLAGAPFETVTRALSDFADRALDRAIATAIGERMPDVPATGMVAIALGKQGSRELNYSSDVDPILLFDPATLPHRRQEEPVEAAVRYARRIVELLQERTADGYVLRVDLRLRPASEATPLAVPIDMAIAHYESSALPWERAAFIRARSAAGDIALGQSFLDHLRPFVWRRALDYGAIREIRGLSRRIRDHHAQGQQLGPGYDVKRGRGGIREVEFFAQIHQLIHGGRIPAARAPATLDALAGLAAQGLIPADDAAALADAYRIAAHDRASPADDRRSSDASPADRTSGHATMSRTWRGGRMDGCAGGSACPACCRDRRLYDALEQEEGEGLPQAHDSLEDRLTEAGFADAAAARSRIEGVAGRPYAHHAQPGRARRAGGGAAASDRGARMCTGTRLRARSLRQSRRAAAECGQSVPLAGGAPGADRPVGRHIQPRADLGRCPLASTPHCSMG